MDSGGGCSYGPCGDWETRVGVAFCYADRLADVNVATNIAIGQCGVRVLHEAWEACGCPDRLEIAAHCNAGWLACVDRRTALAGIYTAHDAGLPLPVWVNETRPVNQGARLTTCELIALGVKCTLQVASACGSRMKNGGIPACLVGAERVTAAYAIRSVHISWLLPLPTMEFHFMPYFLARGLIDIVRAAISKVRIGIPGRLYG